MILRLHCRACDHLWQLRDDVDQLVALCCPACGQQALARASEDFAAAVEDALCQLHWLGKAFAVQLQLDSDQLPAAYVPPAGGAEGDHDLQPPSRPAPP